MPRKKNPTTEDYQAKIAALKSELKHFCCNKHDKRVVGVRIRKDGAILCLACERERHRRWIAKKKQAALDLPTPTPIEGNYEEDK